MASLMFRRCPPSTRLLCRELIQAGPPARRSALSDMQRKLPAT